MKFSKTSLLMAVLACGMLWLPGCKKKAPETLSATHKVFGTDVTITVYDQGRKPEELKPVFDGAFAFLANWEQQVLTPGPNNQVHHISSGAGKESVTADSAVFQMLMKSIRLYDLSGETFDVRYGPMIDAWGFGKSPHVPSQQQLDTLKAYVTDGGMFVAGNGILLARPGMRFDVREIAQGYAFDLLAGQLAQKGLRSFTIHSPYVWRMAGEAPDKRGFEVTFGNPARPDSAWATVWVPAGGIAYAAVSKDRFVADGRPYHSLLDPRTGMPANKCVGAMVHSADAATAQALAYGVFVFGTPDSLNASGKEQVSGVAVISGTPEKPQIKATGSLADKFEIRK